jgi:hypothetical protein
MVKHDGHARSFRANGDSGRHIAGGVGVAEQDMTKSLTRQTFGASQAVLELIPGRWGILC